MNLKPKALIKMLEDSLIEKDAIRLRKALIMAKAMKITAPLSKRMKKALEKK